MTHFNMYGMSAEAELYDWIIERKIVSEETLNIVTSINGYSIETMNDVIYAATGYHNREQLEECGM